VAGLLPAGEALETVENLVATVGAGRDAERQLGRVVGSDAPRAWPKPCVARVQRLDGQVAGVPGGVVEGLCGRRHRRRHGVGDGQHGQRRSERHGARVAGTERPVADDAEASLALPLVVVHLDLEPGVA